MENSKHIFLIDSDQKRNRIQTHFLESRGFQIRTSPTLHEVFPDLIKMRNPCLLIIENKEFDPDRINMIRKKNINLGIVLLIDNTNPEYSMRFLEKNLADHILISSNLSGILAAAKSTFQKMELIRINNLYLKTINKLDALEKKHARETLELEEIYGSTLENLMTALDIRDVETFGHSRTVAKYTQILAQIIGITDKTRLENIRKGALLHDIGKIAIPDSILKKPSSLSRMEWEKIRFHPALGYGLIKEIKMVEEVGNIILYHHERFDGKGYPKGLKKDEIPLEARIFMLADALDAITSHRPYRRRRSFSDAKNEIHNSTETQFDPDVVKAFDSLALDKWEKIRYETTKLLPGFETFIETQKLS